MKRIIVSAPGKLMLLGEHAVVYGKPCLVTAVNQRMQATVELTDTPFFQLEAPDVNVTGYKKPMESLGKGDIPKGAKFVEIALKNFISHIRGRLAWLGGIKITTRSEFSSQFGFGSSSASTVCVIMALFAFLNDDLAYKQSLQANLKKEIFKIAFKTVLDIQGKGSGFDVAAAIYGGTLHFIAGGKLIKPLNIANLPLIIGYTGVKADTITLVNQVSDLAQKYPEIVDNIYSQILLLVEIAKKGLEKNRLEEVGEVMNINQGFLASLGVSSDRLSSLIYAARNAGAYGAKLSGAGGGDCMIALAPPAKVSAVKKAITAAGGQIIDIEVNAEGVKVI